MLALVNEEIKGAMLKKNATRLGALRSLKSALVKVVTDNPSITELSQEEAVKVVHKQINQRKDSIKIYVEQNRTDLAEIENDEVSVLQEFLPKQLTREEVIPLVTGIIKECGASSIKDMGRVMGVATKKLSGKIDNKTLGEIIKELLS